MDIAEKAESGSVILCMLPDNGERFLASPLFEDIEELMMEEEVAQSLLASAFNMPPTTP